MLQNMLLHTAPHIRGQGSKQSTQGDREDNSIFSPALSK